MKLSYNWLKEFVDINVTPDQLARDLNFFGHEVEGIKKIENDWILDLSITANRGDCLSVLGVTREIAALYNLKLKTQNLKPQLKTKKLTKEIKIKISDPMICSRFTARIIDNIKVCESPKWMQDRLKLVGFRPINNIVDITNLIMIETGQPLHAFDYDKIHDRKMNIRLAKIGESVITLDGKNRQIDGNSIIIEDGKKIFDLAGIMGGANSEVDINTKTIILQAAIFNKKLIRATSKKLNHITDASYRYERGVDINGTTPALEIASHFILKDCPSGKSGGIIDIKPKDNKDYSIQIDVNKINNLLGTNLPNKQIVEYLSRLNILTDPPATPSHSDGGHGQPINKLTNQLIFNIPSYRQHDLFIWQDLAEEVARIHGYNKLDKNLPFKNQRQSATKSALISDQYDTKEHLKDILAENGFTEIYSYSFTDKKLMQMLGINLNNCRRVINSVAPELEYLRYDLRPSILSAVAKNPWAPEIKIFEIGRVFDTKNEKNQLVIAECSKNEQGIKQVLDKLGIISDIITPDQKVLDYLKIRRPVRYVIIDLDDRLLKKLNFPRQSALEFKSASISVRYKPISQFPPTIRDLAFIVDKKTNADDICSQISHLDSHILLVELFDEFFFSSEKSTDANQRALCGSKNLAYHIWMQDLTKPMNPKDVDCITNEIIKDIEAKFNAKLR